MLSFDHWTAQYYNVFEKIFGGNYVVRREQLIQYFKKNYDPEWTALLIIQENERKLEFNYWKKFVDYLIFKLVRKETDEIDDLPYWDLWNQNTNPIIVGFHAVYNSYRMNDNVSIVSGSLIKHINFIKMWENSKYYNLVHNKIEHIISNLFIK